MWQLIWQITLYIIATVYVVRLLWTRGQYERAWTRLQERVHFVAASAPGLNHYSDECHLAAKQWWHDIETGARLDRNKGEMLMLQVSEIAEAMEGARKNAMDDKLPHRLMEEVELADALIRIFDYAGAYGFDLEGAYREKLAYNATRADHKKENRLKADGKKF